MARHLIFGGLGFIGRHVALNLVAQGETVILHDRIPASDTMKAELDAATGGKLIETLSGDLQSADFPVLLDGIDTVHHYAWSTIPQTANEAPLADLDQNVRPTLLLLETLRREKLAGGPARRIVFASSGGTVYGRLRQTPVPESHPFAPITAYGVSKTAVELYFGFYREIAGLDCRVARISNPFGAGQDPLRLQGAASAFVFKALANEEITIWGDGSVVRDFIHITDLAEGLSTLALVDAVELEGDPVVNIGSGKGISLSAIVATIAEHLGREVPVDYRPGRPFDIPVSVLDITRAKQYLAWEPRLSFSNGCARMISDLQAGRNWLSSSQ